MKNIWVDRCICREDIFEPWVEFLKKTPAKRYKAFSMRAEFATAVVVRPPPAAEEEAR